MNLCTMYISICSWLHYAAMDNTGCECTDPTRIYHFVASINYTSIVDEIAKHVWNAPQMLLDVFEKTNT